MHHAFPLSRVSVTSGRNDHPGHGIDQHELEAMLKAGRDLLDLPTQVTLLAGQLGCLAGILQPGQHGRSACCACR